MIGCTFLIGVRAAVLDTSDASFVPANVIQNGLDNVGLDANVSHTRCHRAAQVVQRPVLDIADHIKRSLAFGPCAVSIQPNAECGPRCLLLP